LKIPALGTDFQNTGQAGEIPAIWQPYLHFMQHGQEGANNLPALKA